ncbi:lipase [Verticillium alfalfae VaMs.102]|uniref:Carboxylic ester hydrolase n=1 Tax=Verticillium alfalfae (strain VaMs.102 / ATCC MYA-4576 / FGSC 10136) TaxID=526221 RepID=C9STW5_VERA1|nr:lipase [Verticillium alfalfae VaMs.102]EEY22276.1 lipase [Verticillium alfalfae VaMs.102]
MKHTNTLRALLGAAQIVWCLPDCNHKPVVLEGYGSFSGTDVSQTFTGKDLPETVDAWLGIDYATQPTGDGRFRPITWPEPFDGIKSAAEYGLVCPQVPTAVDPLERQGEACLNFNIYRTRGIPLDEKLPVLLWIHGGAFVRRSYASFDAASFVANSPEPMVVITFNYRLGALGFLPSPLFEDEGILNLAIRDQRHFLEFAQKHVSSFGGHPDAVTIGGLSAGAHSVAIHTFHNYGEDEGKPLFARAWLQSGSVTARAFPNASYPLYQRQFNDYVDLVGCGEAVKDSNAAAMACLRSADIDSTRNASNTVFQKYNPAITWPFQPVTDGPLFEKAGSQSGYDETFFKVPVLTTTTTDEAKNYIPGTLETNDEFINFLHNISPSLNSTDIALLEALYPDPATNSDSPYAGSPNSTQYNRLSAAWSDYAYICPSQETAYRMSNAGLPAWKLRWNANNNFPAWQGIPHAADMQYSWAEPTTQYPNIAQIYHSYLASFVLTGDPNKLRKQGSTEWPAYTPAGYGAEAEAPLQLVVGSDGPEVEKDDIRRGTVLVLEGP